MDFILRRASDVRFHSVKASEFKPDNIPMCALPMKKSLKCGKCDQYFDNFPSCMAHIRDKHQKLRCKFCKQLFRTRNMLLEHFRSIHKNADRTCQTCGRWFVYFDILYEHEKKCSSSELKCTDVCNVCGKSFEHKKHFLAHVVTHIGVMPYYCDQCFKACISERQLQIHLPFHGKSPNLQYKKKKSCKHICHICGKAFGNGSKLISHYLCHIKKMNYVCKICHVLFFERTDLTIHSHLHKTGDHITCDICSLTFASKIDCLSHVVTHNRSKLFRRFNYKSLNIEDEKKCDLLSGLIKKQEQGSVKASRKRSFKHLQNSDYIYYSDKSNDFCNILHPKSNSSNSLKSKGYNSEIVQDKEVSLGVSYLSHVTRSKRQKLLCSDSVLPEPVTKEPSVLLHCKSDQTYKKYSKLSERKLLKPNKVLDVHSSSTGKTLSLYKCNRVLTNKRHFIRKLLMPRARFTQPPWYGLNLSLWLSNLQKDLHFNCKNRSSAVQSQLKLLRIFNLWLHCSGRSNTMCKTSNVVPIPMSDEKCPFKESINKCSSIMESTETTQLVSVVRCKNFSIRLQKLPDIIYNKYLENHKIIVKKVKSYTNIEKQQYLNNCITRVGNSNRKLSASAELQNFSLGNSDDSSNALYCGIPRQQIAKDSCKPSKALEEREKNAFMKSRSLTKKRTVTSVPANVLADKHNLNDVQLKSSINKNGKLVISSCKVTERHGNLGDCNVLNNSKGQVKPFLLIEGSTVDVKNTANQKLPKFASFSNCESVVNHLPNSNIGSALDINSKSYLVNTNKISSTFLNNIDVQGSPDIIYPVTIKQEPDTAETSDTSKIWPLFNAPIKIEIDSDDDLSYSDGMQNIMQQSTDYAMLSTPKAEDISCPVNCDLKILNSGQSKQIPFDKIITCIPTESLPKEVNVNKPPDNPYLQVIASTTQVQNIAELVKTSTANFQYQFNSRGVVKPVKFSILNVKLSTSAKVIENCHVQGSGQESYKQGLKNVNQACLTHKENLIRREVPRLYVKQAFPSAVNAQAKLQSRTSSIALNAQCKLQRQTRSSTLNVQAKLQSQREVKNSPVNQDTNNVPKITNVSRAVWLKHKPYDNFKRMKLENFEKLGNIHVFPR